MSETDVEWLQPSLPGYTLEEALALSTAGLHSETDQSSTLMKQQTLNKLIEWLSTGADGKPDLEHQRAKRLLFHRRLLSDEQSTELANRVVQGGLFDNW